MKSINPLDDDDVREWLERVGESIRTDMLPKMRSSRFVLGLLERDNIDPFLLVQVGAAVLLEKPLIVFALGGAWVSPTVRRLADAVIEGESIRDPAVRERAEAAITKLLERLAREERPT